MRPSSLCTKILEKKRKRKVYKMTLSLSCLVTLIRFLEKTLCVSDNARRPPLPHYRPQNERTDLKNGNTVKLFEHSFAGMVISHIRKVVKMT